MDNTLRSDQSPLIFCIGVNHEKTFLSFPILCDYGTRCTKCRLSILPEDAENRATERGTEHCRSEQYLYWNGSDHSAKASYDATLKATTYDSLALHSIPLGPSIYYDGPIGESVKEQELSFTRYTMGSLKRGSVEWVHEEIVADSPFIPDPLRAYRQHGYCFVGAKYSISASEENARPIYAE